MKKIKGHFCSPSHPSHQTRPDGLDRRGWHHRFFFLQHLAFATLLYLPKCLQHGFCNNFISSKKFATLQFATYPKLPKFLATFFCNNNVAKMPFYNIFTDVEKTANILSDIKFNNNR